VPVTDDLPPGMRLDPRPGPHGGQHAIITCVICGKEVRLPMARIRYQAKRGIVQRTCSVECGAEYRRRRGRAK